MCFVVAFEIREVHHVFQLHFLRFLLAACLAQLVVFVKLRLRAEIMPPGGAQNAAPLNRGLRTILVLLQRLFVESLRLREIRQPRPSMHPSQGSQSCTGLFRLSCFVFPLPIAVLFCHPFVLHCLVSFVLQCAGRCLQIRLLRPFLGPRRPLHWDLEAALQLCCMCSSFSGMLPGRSCMEVS